MGKSEKKSKKRHKHKHHKEKHKSKKSKKHSKTVKEEVTTKIAEAAAAVVDKSDGEDQDFAIPIALMNSKSHAPETPEEYQRRQSQIRREVDPVTGRIRLIKGDSEILEEIVSKERHGEINRNATRGDGEYYETQSLAAAARKKQKPK
ncbi:ADP-ribosylation factor-like protein 6-interacting protein 4 isoform X2 [Scaptodrosophila lebanonensis]|uniref:ADP-ribosylation factor-like protein 6-interacting protein 4 n=1 Tax=Drosophila lebanonensis TaxID=7225 RepID=A0A6J2T2W2_DROLE|nr:ADP-ribosylation factor-like protein 6-interacting protein 4 isoform X2 [Scaptodrosophila lebanonensis]